MDANPKATEPEEQAAETRRLWESSYGHRHEDWPDPLREPYEPTQDELDLLHSQMPGHQWNGWRRLTGGEDYFAACSCGWRSTETRYVSPMLRQVKDHLDAVRAVRGWRPAAPTARAPGGDGPARGASQHGLLLERARELYASVESQQRRLSQALEQSTDLLSASEEQADRLVVTLEHAATRVAPEWAKTEASVRRAEALQRRADRARELRDGIVAAAGALAAIAEEVTLLNQDRKTRRAGGPPDTSLTTPSAGPSERLTRAVGPCPAGPGRTYRGPVPDNDEIRLRDGRVVVLRVAAQADVPRIAELYAELSADSFRRRFHSGRPKPVLLARLARLDVAPGTVSLVAVAPGPQERLVAEARYVPDAEDSGELALVVLDDFQGLGLGRRMLSALTDHARASGLERLSAIVSLSNSTMLHLLTRRGAVLTEPADESFVVCLEISAAGGMPGWPRASAGQRILVERRGWFADRRVAALRAAGGEVRQCGGPDRRSGRACPLVAEGRCRLAEDADRIVTLLPGDDADCVAVTEAHQRLWPGKLTPVTRADVAGN